ncbi:methyltransferase family protein [Algoriphagus boseongensis]|uniref:Methyltransferase family protein n=1 Tax=Algoriphagus boseongensis TaxID=1442587 RepID=A0A4V3D264_9BACT|nr:methyltransferase domain-containing protein [Algoriphagus boseongensis]TDQ17190.1 methyltransferase family protein [Algoriphagus boseongensis]
MPIEENSSICPFCKGTDLLSFSAQERMLGLGDTFHYNTCTSCASIQISEVPSKLSDFYPKEYYSFEELSRSNWIKRTLKLFRMIGFRYLGLFPPIYGYWLRKINPDFNARIADVGCGSGQLIYELSLGGYSRLEGYDPFIPKDKKISDRVFLFKKGIEEADGKFDLIMMHHAFEHMANPEEVLNTCFAKLNPGGKLLVRCPVSDSQVWKEKGNLWVQLDAPRHLVIPSVEGMRILSQKVGLNLDEVEFDSNGFQFWGTSLYEKGERLDLKKLSQYFSSEELKEFEKKALQFNKEGKGDQACFYLSKPL